MSPTPANSAEEQLEDLERKIERALAVLADTRQARKDLEAENSRLRRELAESDRERSEVRRRLERILKQIDSLASE
jgi:septal ring factor EnvC (AmiA/AmiB activator)